MRNPTPRRGAGGETYEKASEMRVYGCDHRPTSPTLRHLIGTTLPTPRRGVSHSLAAPRLQDYRVSGSARSKPRVKHLYAPPRGAPSLNPMWSLQDHMGFSTRDTNAPRRGAPLRWLKNLSDSIVHVLFPWVASRNPRLFKVAILSDCKFTKTICFTYINTVSHRRHAACG